MNIHEQYFHQTDISVMIKDIERRDNNNGAYCLFEIAALFAMILFCKLNLWPNCNVYINMNIKG